MTFSSIAPFARAAKPPVAHRPSLLLSLSSVAVLVVLSVWVRTASASVLLHDSFGFDLDRMDAQGRPITIGLGDSLDGIRAETPGPDNASWTAKNIGQGPSWAFSTSSPNPARALNPSPLEEFSNGSVSLVNGVGNDLAAAMLPFTPSSTSFRLSLDMVGTPGEIAIGFSSNPTAVDDNFSRFGQAWLQLTIANQTDPVNWTLHTRATSVSGVSPLNNFNAMSITYDPINHIVHGSVNGTDTPSLSYAAQGIAAAGFEGSGTVDHFILETTAVPEPVSCLAAMGLGLIGFGLYRHGRRAVSDSK